MSGRESHDFSRGRDVNGIGVSSETPTMGDAPLDASDRRNEAASVADDQRRLLALCASGSVGWSLIAREAQSSGGLDALWRESSATTDEAQVLFDRVDAELAAARDVGARLVTVLDDDYPANLRLVHNLPPFLFIRGEVREQDVRSVAVVGTRDASPAGLRRARRMATLLFKHGVTVVSGLARGIDTAAHRAALEAGGRAIAVLGTGITRCDPPENHDLAEEVALHGAPVWQFWTIRSPGRDAFPRRNVVTSGLSQGTVVIEASSTSGAKMQARLALEHGKVFLVRSLVAEQKWAQEYVRRGAIEVANVEAVVRHLVLADEVCRAAEARRFPSRCGV